MTKTVLFLSQRNDNGLVLQAQTEDFVSLPGSDCVTGLSSIGNKRSVDQGGSVINPLGDVTTMTRSKAKILMSL